MDNLQVTQVVAKIKEGNDKNLRTSKLKRNLFLFLFVNIFIETVRN
jgi:hypothetical protein